MPRLFEGRHSFVTGGTSGIGQAIAIAMAELGAEVTTTGLTAEEVANFDSGGRNIKVLAMDVVDQENVNQIVGGFDRLDYVVNCAGMILRDGQEHDPQGFARVVDVNLNGVMRVCSACKPLLTKSRGSVVNIASMLSFFGSGPAPAYSASKGGIAQLTKSLAIAWADDAIRVNAVAPGWIETALTGPLVEDEKRNQAIVERTPLRRWGMPTDVAGAVVFLCSPAAAFITGVVLPVDGGYSIM